MPPVRSEPDPLSCRLHTRAKQVLSSLNQQTIGARSGQRRIGRGQYMVVDRRSSNADKTAQIVIGYDQKFYQNKLL